MPSWRCAADAPCSATIVWSLGSCCCTDAQEESTGSEHHPVLICGLQAMLRAHRSSAADVEQQAAAERAEAEARQQEAAARAAVREAALVVQRRYRARRAAQQASDLANRQKVTQPRKHAQLRLEGLGWQGC
jgi:hypothetical protein